MTGRVRDHWSSLHPWLRTVVGAVAVLLIIQVLFGRLPLLNVGLGDKAIPMGIAFNGAVIGSLYGLLGIGLILIYRTQNIINFAQASLGAVPATVALLLIQVHGWPYLAALTLALVFAALLGGGVEAVFMRRFEDAPRMIVTVATLGVALALSFVEPYLPRWIGGGGLAGIRVPTPFQGLHFRIGIVRFSGDHIVAVVVVAAVMLLLTWTLRKTQLGLAMRAAAENRDRALLMGVPVSAISIGVWSIAAMLSTVGVFLRAPLVGLPIGSAIGPSVLLFGLAAAVLAGLRSLPGALVAGMALGVLDQSVVFSTQRAGLSYVILLPVLLLALLSRKAETGRAFQVGSFTWSDVVEPRSMAALGLSSVQAQTARYAATAVSLATVIVAPLLLPGQVARLTQFVIYVILGLSLVVLTGWGGQISLGQFGVAGVGAAIAGAMAVHLHADFFLTLFSSMAAGSVAAVLIGLPAMRLPSLYLPVTTMAFAFFVPNLLLDRNYFGWLLPKDGQFVERPVLYGKLSIDTDLRFYYLATAIAGLAIVGTASLRALRTGRLLISAAGSANVLSSYGTSPFQTRLKAFAMSGALAGMAGCLLAFQYGSLDPQAFNPLISLNIFVMAVVGGLGSVFGAVLGAAFVVLLPSVPLLHRFETVSSLLASFGLALVLLNNKGGLAAAFYALRDRTLLHLTNPHADPVADPTARLSSPEQRPRLETMR